MFRVSELWRAAKSIQHPRPYTRFPRPNHTFARLANEAWTPQPSTSSPNPHLKSWNCLSLSLWHLSLSMFRAGATLRNPKSCALNARPATQLPEYVPSAGNLIWKEFEFKNNLQSDFGHFRANNQIIISKVAKIALRDCF